MTIYKTATTSGVTTLEDLKKMDSFKDMNELQLQDVLNYVDVMSQIALRQLYKLIARENIGTDCSTLNHTPLVTEAFERSTPNGRVLRRQGIH